MRPTYLIAGCGDLGLRAADLLLAAGHRVHGLRRSPPATAPAGLQWHAADLTRPTTLATLPADITHVLYAVTPGGRNEAAYRAVFIEGLQALTRQLVPSLQRIVFASSSAVYGEHHGAWVDEATPVAPLAFNGRVLAEAEQWLASLPLETVSLRLAGLYGPGRLSLLDRLRRGEARAPREPLHWANRMHADDAAAALAHLLALPAPAPTYIGCDDTPMPLHDLYQTLAGWVGAPDVAIGPAPQAVGSKRLSNACLKASGFEWRWPDSLAGYRALIDAEPA